MKNDELNYKEAYYYLFNQITDLMINMTKKMMKIQRKSENICIDDIPVEGMKIDTEEALKNLIYYIKNQREPD